MCSSSEIGIQNRAQPRPSFTIGTSTILASPDSPPFGANFLATAVNQLVGAVYVLSVKSFTDRIAHIRAELARHGIDFEWIFDYDADEVTSEQIEAVFAPSDLKRGHQSLVLKHIETWKRCVEQGHRRVLVFEDDAVLARNFERVFAEAMREADALDAPYMIYLGCGDNKYVEGAARSPTQLIAPDSELPATDATVLDSRAAQLRLDYVRRQKITRPADWLMREADAAMGVRHWWLRQPIVEQGSMNGRFASVLDDRRVDRGLAWNRWRFRWDRLRRRWLGSTRPAAAYADFGEERARVRRDFWAISAARAGAAIALAGTLFSPPVTNAGEAMLVLSFASAPSARERIAAALRQPLGAMTVVLIAVLGISILWSAAPLKLALSDWAGWRQLICLIVALAVFDERAAKPRLAAFFVAVATIGALVSYVFLLRGISVNPELPPGIVLRNHVTQGIGLSMAALLAAVLGWLAAPYSWQRRTAFGACLLLASNVVFVSTGRSGHAVLAVLAVLGILGLARGRARLATLAALVLIGIGIVAVSPVIKDRFALALEEVQQTRNTDAPTAMGMRVVMWETSAELIRQRPWLGYGMAGFAPAYEKLAATRNAGWRAWPTRDPHNQYLFILATAGLLGLAVFAAWLLSATRQPVRGPFRVVGLALLASWCLTSLFSSHFQAFNEGHMIALALGVFLARERDQEATASAASTVAMTSA
jgi:glycosyl transferase family 25